jgi:7-carboxy-7-deazaguanine synthase
VDWTRKAICQFCDTDFIGTDGLNGGRFKTAADVAAKVNEIWENSVAGGVSRSEIGMRKDAYTEGSPQLKKVGKKIKKYVVCTGGEPALQLDRALIDAFHALGFEIAIETNGTIALAEGIDWVCVSPKAGTEIVVKKGSELKLVFPQTGAEPELFADLAFDNFYIQPMDSPLQAIHQKMALDFCLQNPQWKLSLQTHKILDIA